MRWSTLLRLSLVLVAGALAAGCASSCGSNATKLSELRRGMSYGETARIMGCNGLQVSQATVASGDFATVEWDGPISRIGGRTQMDFLDGRLLSFTTDRRYGL